MLPIDATYHIPDVPTLRELSVRFNVDPRTIVAVIDGRDVRGMAGVRATPAQRGSPLA